MTDIVERMVNREARLLRSLAIADEEITRLRTERDSQRAEIERLQSENFTLAAGQCVNVTADEGGRPMCAEIERLRAALTELVALKDMKDSIEHWLRDESTGEQWPAMPLSERMVTAKEYSKRKPLAWGAARAALKETK